VTPIPAPVGVPRVTLPVAAEARAARTDRTPVLDSGDEAARTGAPCAVDLVVTVTVPGTGGLVRANGAAQDFGGDRLRRGTLDRCRARGGNPTLGVASADGGNGAVRAVAVPAGDLEVRHAVLRGLVGQCVSRSAQNGHMRGGRMWPFVGDRISWRG